MANSLQTSYFTSIKERIIQYKAHQQSKNMVDFSAPSQPSALLPFAGRQNTKDIPFSLTDYMELVDWSGRHLDPKKTGYIADSEPKIIDILGIEEDVWLEAIKNFRRQYGSFAGSEKILRSCAHQHGQGWYIRMGQSQKYN